MAKNRKLLQYFKKPEITFDAFRNEVYPYGVHRFLDLLVEVLRS